MDPLTTPAPDDTGSDTFARYRYQARVAFPFCVACALGQGVRSVLCEHIEDILVETDEGWRFLQVKTRDESLGPWHLSDITKDGGGLDSLLRAHRTIGDLSASLELHLEGSLAVSDNLLGELTAVGDGRSTALVTRVAKRLGLALDDCAAFLRRVVVRAAPARALVTAVNMQVIAGIQPNITMATAERLHDQVTEDVCRAMEADLVGPNWLSLAIGVGAPADDVERRIDAKRLTPARLDAYRRRLAAVPTPGLLQRAAGAPPAAESDLTRKLKAAGAGDPLIQHAHALRANAASQEIALLAKSLLLDDQRLEDVQMRLVTLATPIADRHRGAPQAAASVFNEILREARRDPRSLDPHGLFGADPFVLVGEVCQLSDGCRCDWG